MKIKKGDKVMVTIGKDNGKQGTVEKVMPKDNQVVVSGVNSYKRHVKGREGIEGGILELNKPVAIANVQLVCPNCQKATRVGFAIDKAGKKRVCKKCKKEIN